MRLKLEPGKASPLQALKQLEGSRAAVQTGLKTHTQPASISTSGCRTISAKVAVLSICLTLSLNFQQNKRFGKLRLCLDGLVYSS